MDAPRSRALVAILAMIVVVVVVAFVMEFAGPRPSVAFAASPPPSRATVARAPWICSIPERRPSASERPDGDLDVVFAVVRTDVTLGAPLLERAATLGVSICLDPGLSWAFSVLDPTNLRIRVAADLDLGSRALFLVHELRHLDTLARGYCPSVTMPLGDVDRLLLASEADAQAVAALYAWRAREAGWPEAWTSLEANPLYADIAAAFARALRDAGDELAATRAAFAQWYANDARVKPYHLVALQHQLHAQRVLGAPDAVEPIEAGWFDGFCTLPDGTDYEGVPPTDP